MKLGRWTVLLDHCLVVGVMLGGLASQASAQSHDDHAVAPQSERHNPRAGALVKAVRKATKGFHDVSRAKEAGYALQFGCVSGGDFGAMGLHFVKGPLVGDGEIDVMNPEIVLYEPLPNGDVKLTGADYLVLAADWDAKHPAPPELMGQLFHLFEAPNRFGLPPFYTLHVWAWKGNPSGTFGNWNPNVKCDAFNPETQAP
jgi:hypothetical protein